MKKKDSGITLIALTITIIVLLILIAVSVKEGNEFITKSRANTLKTSMLVIESKSKNYAEEIDAIIWTESNKDNARNTEFSKKGFSVYASDISTSVFSSQINTDINMANCIVYTISNNGFEDMGLDIKDEEYIVIYDKEDFKKVDVIYTNGFKYKGSIIYSLSKMKQELAS